MRHPANRGRDLLKSTPAYKYSFLIVTKKKKKIPTVRVTSIPIFTTVDSIREKKKQLYGRL